MSILKFEPQSDPKDFLTVCPNYVVLRSRCPICADRMIENARFIECGGRWCGYIETKKEDETRHKEMT